MQHAMQHACRRVLKHQHAHALRSHAGCCCWLLLLAVAAAAASSSQQQSANSQQQQQHACRFMEAGSFMHACQLLPMRAWGVRTVKNAGFN